MEKSLVELEREITCAICQEHYTQPKVLPCLHYYCKQCILNLALRTGTVKPFSCPECRKEAILPDDGVDQLPTAFFVNRLKAAFPTLEQAHRRMEFKCEACSDSGAKAEAFCRQCALFICSKCVESHQRLKKMFDGHKIASFQELEEGSAQEMVMEEPQTGKCPFHKEPLIIYCFDCSALICHHCTVKDHKDHNFEFSAVAAPRIKEKLMEELQPLREVRINLSHAVEEIQTTKHELEVQKDSIANTVKTSFQEMHDILEKYEQKLLEEAGTKVREKTANLLLQEENLSSSSAKVQSVLDYTEECVRHCADNEVMCAQAEIRSRIKWEIEEHDKTGRRLEPLEEVDVGVEVRCGEALRQLCQTSVKITQLCVDPAKCQVIGAGAKAAEVDHTTEVSLVTKLSNNKTTKSSTKVDSQLKSLYNGSVIKCEVDRLGAGEYRIQYRPTVRGRHKLTVTVNGKHVAGSPFPVFVSLPPTLLGKPVRVWAGISRPTGVAVNSVGEIIVAESQGDVVVFDREGKRLRSIKLSKLAFCSLAGVAVDDRDNIYLVSYDDDTIFKLNNNGSIVQKKEVKHVIGTGHRCVAVVGEEVMVCECHNQGSIVVYDRELEYVRQILGRSMGEFYDISPDLHSNLYVTDYSNSCILIFSCSGDLLRSFGCDLNGVKKLSAPRSVCLTGQYVYVTDFHKHTVSVFTTEGEYVTSFGQSGTGEGDFYGPHRVCAEEGFVYVCDIFNDRLQVF